MTDRPTETLQRHAWEAGFRLCRSYGDNWIHWTGAQKERCWAKYLAQADRPLVHVHLLAAHSGEEPQTAMPVSVTHVRTFRSMRKELGVGCDRHSWFVYDRSIGETEWHKHCGPYSTSEQAAQWIFDIREVR